MTVTVLPIIEPAPIPALPLAKVMNERLRRLAQELQETHLKGLNTVEPLYEDVVIYIGYNNKYNIRWKIVNDVPQEITTLITEQCDKLGYLKWKDVSLYKF